MSRFCTSRKILCYTPACTQLSKCMKPVTVEDTDSDLGDDIAEAIAVGAVIASAFSDFDPVNEAPDTFTGNGGDFGGGGASDDF